MKLLVISHAQGNSVVPVPEASPPCRSKHAPLFHFNKPLSVCRRSSVFPPEGRMLVAGDLHTVEFWYVTSGHRSNRAAFQLCVRQLPRAPKGHAYLVPSRRRRRHASLHLWAVPYSAARSVRNNWAIGRRGARFVAPRPLPFRKNNRSAYAPNPGADDYAR
jgi:hypothetical protein